MNQELRKFCVKKRVLFYGLLLHSENGFSVIEVMLASALFIIFSSGIISVVLHGFDANRTGSEETIANQYATEGIEAGRSIKNQNFASLVNTLGTGITASSSGVWKFNGANNTLSKYTRVITVSDVQRDAGGNIVSSGGAVDANTKKVTSTVSWKVTPSRSDSVVLTTYFTSWRNQSQASCLQVNTASASRNKKTVIGITLQNSCSSGITLTQMTPSWTQSSNQITQIQINGSVAWSSGGVGSPTGTQASGIVLTLQSVSFVANSAVIPLDLLQMTGNVQPAEVWTIVFTMSDGSQNSVSFTTP